MTPRELALHIERLNARDLVELNRLLRDLPGWDGIGVREPRRPIQPTSSANVTLTITPTTDPQPPR